MKLSLSRKALYGILLLALLFFGWKHFASDPRSAFLAEVSDILESANEGEHLSLRKKFSPDAETLISNNFMTVPQALLWARKMDTDGNIRYRIAALNVFYPRDYAEVEIERSGNGGDFSNARRSAIPFVYQKGQWLVGGGFRGEREFTNPFE